MELKESVNWMDSIIFTDSISEIQGAIKNSIDNCMQDEFGDNARAGMRLTDGRILVATFSIATEWYGSNRWPTRTRKTRVQLYSPTGVVKKTYCVPNRTGNWMQKAAIELLNPREGKVDKINLDRRIRVKKITQRMSITFYKRTIAGVLLDFVAASGRVVFHATTKREALAGLAMKIGGQPRMKQRTKLNFKTCLKLGFCKSGIAEFCDTFHLDINKSYSPEQIGKIIEGDRRADIYQFELKKAGVV